MTATLERRSGVWLSAPAVGVATRLRPAKTCCDDQRSFKLTA
jgi:hypothetical protein